MGNSACTNTRIPLCGRTLDKIRIRSLMLSLI